MTETFISIAAKTNQGARRNNEDNFIVSSNLATGTWTFSHGDAYTPLGEYGALLVVADGMGGSKAGELASAIAVKTIHDCFTPELLAMAVESEITIVNFICEVIHSADLHILNIAKSNNEAKGMGTTIVLAWLYDGKAYVSWCGDSRCYVYNSLRGLAHLTKDHSYVQELIDRGELDPAYAHDHPMANVISRCLGDDSKKATPETRIYDLRHGDILLLCTDGLTSMCSDEKIEHILDDNTANSAECCNALVSAALRAGGFDNVTVALCAVSMLDSEEHDDESRTIRTSVIGRRL